MRPDKRGSVKHLIASLLGILILLVCFSFFGTRVCGDERLPAPKNNPLQVRPGMTAEEVRGVLGGPPKRIARQILYKRYLELWTYDQFSPLWLEFNCLKGQEPRIVNVHSEIKVQP